MNELESSRVLRWIRGVFSRPIIRVRTDKYEEEHTRDFSRF